MSRNDFAFFAFFVLEDCSWLEIDGFSFESSWPSFIALENCDHITIRNLNGVDGINMVFAEDCTHILIEHCEWKQDPTESMWSQLDWQALHHGSHHYYNGAFLYGKGLKAQIIVRHNVISDAFNGVRLSSDVREGLNTNVQIHHNKFIRIRDNPIEPERWAVNWWLHHNFFYDCYVLFSLGKVGGRYVLAFCNRGVFVSKPGLPTDEHYRGRILKLSKKKGHKTLCHKHPLIMFHNSWHTRSLLATTGHMAGIKHYNNAFQFCVANQHGYRVCDPNGGLADNELFMTYSKDDNDPPSDEQPSWEKLDFDGDVTTRSFGPKFREFCKEKCGHENYEFEFRNPAADDFTTDRALPKAVDFRLTTLCDWPGRYDWTVKTDREHHVAGLVQADGEIFQGPPFQRDVKHAEDDLHIVEVARESKGVEITFDALVCVPDEPPKIEFRAAGRHTATVEGSVCEND